ncbi:hypothetical protein [Haloechinothrix alba]|uniref:hypothetical protein n=1 Tax=Haloechinothrix alba TaxID=664784 RepID=UPI000B7994AD|nr:hypothetical protein [Haloechinothrix alba]
MIERVVETECVLDRHAATDLSLSYAILVPQRRVRTGRAGQDGRAQHDQCGDVCPAVVGPAEEGRDDLVAAAELLTWVHPDAGVWIAATSTIPDSSVGEADAAVVTNTATGLR